MVFHQSHPHSQRSFVAGTASGVTGIHQLMVKDIVTAWKLAMVEEQKMIFAVMQRGKPMRAIDADRLLEERRIQTYYHLPNGDIAIPLIDIKHASTIESSAQPEIIRCKNCKDYQEGVDINGKPFSRCNGSVRTYGHTMPDWYCADAERREE